LFGETPNTDASAVPTFSEISYENRSRTNNEAGNLLNAFTVTVYRGATSATPSELRADTQAKVRR
jgi:hypothetical protein